MAPSEGLLEGRIGFVTGAARGLGRAIVERLAAAGAIGAGFDRVPATLPSGWQPVQGDVTDEASLAAAIGTLSARHGRLDVVVANAGVVPPWRATAAIDLAEWDAVFAINVRGVVAAIKHAVPAMQARGGAIVAMASINAWRAHPRQCLYTASKHAVLGIVRAAAADLGRHGIRVNAVGPGPIATDALLGRMRERAATGGPALEAALDRYAGETALGRMATADDVANAVLFLASDLSAGITGTITPVECGLP